MLQLPLLHESPVPAGQGNDANHFGFRPLDCGAHTCWVVTGMVRNVSSAVPLANQLPQGLGEATTRGENLVEDVELTSFYFVVLILKNKRSMETTGYTAALDQSTFQSILTLIS